MYLYVASLESAPCSKFSLKAVMVFCTATRHGEPLPQWTLPGTLPSLKHLSWLSRTAWSKRVMDFLLTRVVSIAEGLYCRLVVAKMSADYQLIQIVTKYHMFGSEENSATGSSDCVSLHSYLNKCQLTELQLHVNNTSCDLGSLQICCTIYPVYTTAQSCSIQNSLQCK